MKQKNKGWAHNRRVMILPFILVFSIFGAVVFGVSKNISSEMAASAINNLSDSLDLVASAVETVLVREAEYQKLIAREIADTPDPGAFALQYGSNGTMVKLSLILSGEETGVSNTGGEFTEEGLDFSVGHTVEGLPLSRSYLNSMGTWAYTLKCPVVSGQEEIASLYIEYIYDTIDDALPNGFYRETAKLYLMDATSERLVLKPKGIGERDAGHLNLTDFYRANKIEETRIHESVAAAIQTGGDMMFYHDILNEESLIYMWSVNNGSMYLIGYVPTRAIQQEGTAVNQNIAVVIVTMLAAVLSCVLLYLLFERQHQRFLKEQEAERERYNEQLREALQTAQAANHSKTMFLSNMSHDIRTPMNAILGFAALLAKDADDPARVQDYTRKITASGQHLLGLINDVLDISKIESGKAVLTIDEFQLNDLIASIDAIIRPAAKEKRQNFEIQLTGLRHNRLLGDETRLRQILINLLSNAVKYTQEQGDICLRITGLEQRSSQYEHILIEVEDNGYGMTPEYQETIFDPFTRAENSTTNKVQGTGLGMAITKNIVEMMGGIIEVTSKVDEGSRFRVELELRIPEPAQEDVPLPEAVEEHSLEGLHFLVAEDNEINSEILSELLLIEDATCEIVENGLLAAERFGEAPPGSFDAVLMDVQMPVMNGYDASRAIRALPRADADTIPIIAMTANAFAEDVKDAMDAGMNAHVAKPIDMELLKRTIGQCLSRQTPGP